MDFCEWAWFYRCASVLHGWNNPATDPTLIPNLFIKADNIIEEDCCLELDELKEIIGSLGGLKDSPDGGDFRPIRLPIELPDPTTVTEQASQSM